MRVWTLSNLRAMTALLLIVVNLLIGCIPLYAFGALRLVLPAGARRATQPVMDGIVHWWVGSNRKIFSLLGITEVDARWEGVENLSTHRWYLVISNHQSWADILILQNLFHDRIPMLRFFTKRQLLWVPLLGLAMWFLGFPYVRRLSRERIAADPKLVALDRQAALDACKGFRSHPSTVLTFLEGTRFTAAKHALQGGARFRHLLNPKVGGISYVVTALGDQLHKVLDVTLIYPTGVPSFWKLLQGRCRRVEVRVTGHDLPQEARLTSDPDQVREHLRPWIETLWLDKDGRLTPLPKPLYSRSRLAT
jgi:1-acyl-sn-glycerol-3-phosphate acyltransferase